MAEIDVQELLKTSSYSQEAVPQLEEVVTKQTYDLDASLALLKLYQFYPSRVNVDIVSSILLKAMMRLPQTDYLMCTYLVSDAVQRNENVVKIMNLAQNLEACEFKCFWETVSKSKVASGVAGFEDAIRTFIVGVLKSTYSCAPVAAFAESMGLAEKEVASAAAAHGLTVSGEGVVMPATASNSPVATKADSDRTGSFAGLMGVATTLSR